MTDSKPPIQGWAMLELIEHNGACARVLDMSSSWPAGAWDAIRIEAEARASGVIGEPGIWMFEGDLVDGEGGLGFNGAWSRLGDDLSSLRPAAKLLPRVAIGVMRFPLDQWQWEVHDVDGVEPNLASGYYRGSRRNAELIAEVALQFLVEEGLAERAPDSRSETPT